MKRRLLEFLRVPEHPTPPPGAGDLLTFRPSRRFLFHSLLTWIPRQIGAVFGILASLAFLGAVKSSEFPAADQLSKVADRILGRIPYVGGMAPDAITLITALEIFAIGLFVFQLVVGVLRLKLNWELTWYMVGEESLRIREGVWKLREQTMTLTNIQNMIVRQGPIQRLFGIADLEVHTAGGGNASPAEGLDAAKGSTFHIGRLRGLENAEALRDRLRDRLAKAKGAGLGDAEDEDEIDAQASDAPTMPQQNEAMQAARELLGEARALRRSLGA